MPLSFPWPQRTNKMPLGWALRKFWNADKQAVARITHLTVQSNGWAAVEQQHSRQEAVAQPKVPPPNVSPLRFCSLARTFHCTMAVVMPSDSTSQIAQFSMIGAPLSCPTMVLCSADRNPPCETTITVLSAQCGHVCAKTWQLLTQCYWGACTDPRVVGIA